MGVYYTTAISLDLGVRSKGDTVQIRVKETGYDWGPLELSVDLTEWLIDFIDNITVEYNKNPDCLRPLVEAAYDFNKVQSDMGDTFDIVEEIQGEYEKLTGFKPRITKRYSTIETKILIRKLSQKLAEVE